MFELIQKPTLAVLFSSLFIIFLLEIVSGNVNNESSPQFIKPETQRAYTTYNTCGGYIEARLDQTIILEYKPDEQYANDELCVWVVRNSNCAAALFTKTMSGFESGHDFLQISTFRPALNYPTDPTNLKMGNITGLEQINGRGFVNFVIFSTDDSNTGTGFRMQIACYDSYSDQRSYNDLFSVEPVGNVTLRPYPFNMLQSYIIIPTHKTVQSLVLNIDYVIEIGWDYLTVFTFERRGQSILFIQHVGRLDGTGNRSFESHGYTNFVVFFSSSPNGRPENSGFILNWYIPEITINAENL